MGAGGWSALDRLIVAFALFFYLPPAGAGLPARVEERVLFGLTVFGAVMLLGRIVDSVADPLVASWSDRSRARAGRRRVFLAWSALPLAAAAAAVFFPPVGEPSLANAVYLAVLLGAFFLLFTLYVVPYLALIPELAPDPDGRVHLTTLQAYATLLGAAVVMILTPALVGTFGGGVGGHRAAIVVTCILAAGFLALPALAVDEKRLAAPERDQRAGLGESLRLTLRNRPFLWYLGGNIAYWFAFNIVSSGALYYTTVLMRAEEAFQGVALTATFAVAAVFFYVWNVLGRRLGKRRALLLAGACFVVSMMLFAFVGSRSSGVLAFALAGVPVAALLVLPNAALADCVDLDSRHTGTRREAMYFGAQGFLLKVNLGLSTAVLAALMGALGRDPGNDLGIRLSGPVAAVVVLAGMGCFWRYREEEVLGRQ
jgi:GPH family glycoside/pentoside/hexuronide:cation symporter